MFSENGIRAMWCADVARGTGSLWCANVARRIGSQWCADVARGMGIYNKCESINTVQWLAIMLSIREVRVHILARNAASLRFFLCFYSVRPIKFLESVLDNSLFLQVSFSTFFVHFSIRCHTRC